MANTVTGLVKRIPNGAPLTPQQGDQNLTILETFSNQLSTQLSVSLNPNGTLVNGALSFMDQIGNQPTIADGLQFVRSAITAPFTLGTFTYSLSNTAIQVPTLGSVVQFEAPAANGGAGPWYLQINGATPIQITNCIGQAIPPQSIEAGQIVTVIFDGTNFQLQQAMGAANAIAADYTGGTNSTLITPGLIGALKFVSGLNAIPGLPSASRIVAPIPHGLPAPPTHYRWVMSCQTTDLGYLAPVAGVIGDEVEAIMAVDSSNGLPIFTGGYDATNVYLFINCAGSNIFLPTKSTGARANIATAKWKLKCYADCL